MTLLAVGISLAVFLAALRLSRIHRMASDATDTLRGAMAVIRDRSLDDDDKERMVQQRAVALFKRAALMAATSVALVSAPLLVLAAFHALGLAPLGDSLALIGRWQTIAIAAVLTLTVWLIRR